MIDSLGETPIKLRNSLNEIGLETQIKKVAENCLSTYPLKGWDLRKLIVNGPQDHKSTVKTVCYIIR